MNIMVTGKDVGTFEFLREANMELIDIIPEFNVYEESGKFIRIIELCRNL